MKKDKVITLHSPLLADTLSHVALDNPSVEEAKQKTDKSFKELLKKRLKT